METILTFVVVVAAMMIDPLKLLIAAGIAAIAAGRSTPEIRWSVIAGGTILFVALLAAATSALSAADGHAFRFKWVESTAAAFLQIWLICLAFEAWRHRYRRSS